MKGKWTEIFTRCKKCILEIRLYFSDFLLELAFLVVPKNREDIEFIKKSCEWHLWNVKDFMKCKWELFIERKVD